MMAFIQALDGWQFLAGLGLFLFGMLQLEQALTALFSARLRRWLQQATRHRWQAILVGTSSTALVQSSSMVGLMLLAFVGAGILPLVNAFGIILGANLGTTVTGWLVTALGFKLELARAAFPLAGAGALIWLLLERWPRVASLGQIMLGLGLLLLGLVQMKVSMEGAAQDFDIRALADLSLLHYLLLGTLICALIRSSSATMLITLTALNAGEIDLTAAAAMAIGADLGTTSTVVLGALKGSPIKRQVAAGHVGFNLITDIIAFLLLPWFLLLIRQLGLTDPLYSLVMFHSLFNLMGILLFYPLVRPSCQLLQRLFVDESAQPSALDDVSPRVPEPALAAIRQEGEQVLMQVIHLALREVKLEPGQGFPEPWATRVARAAPPQMHFAECYQQLKYRESALLAYVQTLQQQSLSPEQGQQLPLLLSAVRHWVYSAKAMKDIRNNLAQMRHTVHPGLQPYHGGYQREASNFYREVVHWFAADPHWVGENLEQAEQSCRSRRQQWQQRLADAAGEGVTSELLEIPLNVGYELCAAQISMLHGLRDWQQAKAAVR